MLQVSLFKVRCLERDGVLVPEIRDGLYQYPLEAIQHVLRTVTLPRRNKTPAEGRVAAQVFRLFEAGHNLRAIVIHTKQTPERVRELYAEWSAPDLAEGEKVRRAQAVASEASARLETQADRWSKLLKRGR